MMSPDQHADTWILLSARDEEATISGLVKALRGKNVLVVADNCQDKTAEIAEQAGAVVLRRSGEGGKGAALRFGWAWLARETECERVLLMDADGQHDPADARNFLAADSGVDLVLGNRAPFKLPMPWTRRWCNAAMSRLVSLMTGRTVHDSQCGFRLMGRKLFALEGWRAKNFEIETEIILRAHDEQLRIAEIPVTTRYASQKSHIFIISDTVRWLWFVSGALLRRGRRGYFCCKGKSGGGADSSKRAFCKTR